MVLDNNYFKRLNELAKDKKDIGIYIISEYSAPSNTNDGSKILKVGYSKGLKKRLDSYQTAYQSSFYTWSLIITDTDKQARELEKLMHAFLTWTGQQYFHEEYKPRANPEWFEIPNTEYMRLMIEGILNVFIDPSGVGGTILGVSEIINMHPNIKQSMIRKTMVPRTITVTNASIAQVRATDKKALARQRTARLLPRGMKKYESHFIEIKKYIEMKK